MVKWSQILWTRILIFNKLKQFTNTCQSMDTKFGSLILYFVWKQFYPGTSCLGSSSGCLHVSARSWHLLSSSMWSSIVCQAPEVELTSSSGALGQQWSNATSNIIDIFVWKHYLSYAFWEIHLQTFLNICCRYTLNIDDNREAHFDILMINWSWPTPEFDL